MTLLSYQVEGSAQRRKPLQDFGCKRSNPSDPASLGSPDPVAPHQGLHFEPEIVGDVSQVVYVELPNVTAEHGLVVPVAHLRPTVSAQWNGDAFADVDAVRHSDEQEPSWLQCSSGSVKHLSRRMVEVFQSAE